MSKTIMCYLGFHKPTHFNDATHNIVKFHCLRCGKWLKKTEPLYSIYDKRRKDKS